MTLFSVFQYFGILILLLFSALAIGHLLLQVLPRPNLMERNYPVSLRLSLGTLLPVFFWAVFQTKGVSILSLLVMPLSFMLYHAYKNPSQDKPNETERKKWKGVDLLTYLTLLIVLIFFQLFFFTGFNINVLFPPDVCLYSEMAHYLNWGYENYYGNVNGLQLLDYQHATPYHYGELWLGNLIFNIFPTLSRPGLMLFAVYPLLLFVFISGVFEYFKTICTKGKLWLAIIFSLGMLFVGGILTDSWHPIWSFFARWTVVFETSSGWATQTGLFSHLGQKHLPVYILSFWALVLWLNSRPLLSLMLVLMMPILNIGVAPAIFGAFCASVLLWKLNLRWASQFPAKAIFPFFIAMLLMIVFYVLWGVKIGNDSVSGEEPSGLLSLILDAPNSSSLNLKGMIMSGLIRAMAAVILFFLSFFPFMVVLGFTNRIKSEQLFPFLFLGFMVLVASSTRMVFYGFNSAQLLTYIWPVFSVIGGILSVRILLEGSMPRPRKIFVGCMFFLVFIQNIIYIAQNQKQLRAKLEMTNFFKSFQNEISTRGANLAYIVNPTSAAELPAGFVYYGRCVYSALSGINSTQLYFLNGPEEFLGPKRLNPPSVRNSLSVIPEYAELPLEERQLKFIQRFKVKYLFLEKGTPLPFYVDQTDFWMSDTALNVDIYRVDERHH